MFYLARGAGNCCLWLVRVHLLKCYSFSYSIPSHWLHQFDTKKLEDLTIIWHQKNKGSIYSSFHWATRMGHNQEKPFSQTNSISFLLQVHLKLQANVFMKQPKDKNVKNNTVLHDNKGNAGPCSVSRSSTWGKHMSLLLYTVSSLHTSLASIIVALGNIRRYYPWLSPDNVSRFPRNVSNPFLNQLIWPTSQPHDAASSRSLNLMCKE